MFKELFDLKGKSTQEIGTKIFVITSMIFVVYHITKVVYDNVVEGFDPSQQTNQIGECDVGTPNVGNKWQDYLNKQ